MEVILIVRGDLELGILPGGYQEDPTEEAAGTGTGAGCGHGGQVSVPGAGSWCLVPWHRGDSHPHGLLPLCIGRDQV